MFQQKIYKSSVFHLMSEKSVKKLNSENQTQLFKSRKGLIVDRSRRQGQNRKHKTVIVVQNFAVFLTLKNGASV